jgi:hypothetical protein
MGVWQHPVAVESDVARPAPHREETIGTGAHGVGQVGGVMDCRARGKGEAAIPGLPMGGAGEDRVGLGGIVGVEGIAAVRGLVLKAEEQIVRRDRGGRAEERHDRLDGSQRGRLHGSGGAVLPREPGLSVADQPG